MEYIFIINPSAGNGKGLKIGKVIKEYCESLKINYKIFYTKKIGDAKNIAFKFQNKSVVYSVGGDGTLNEVINGLSGSKSTLGIIPVGTGNDFYKTFKEFKGNSIDLGKVNNRYFINIASIGLDAQIAEYANILKNKNLSKDFSYNISLLKNYFIYKNKPLLMNNIYKNIIILTVCNGKYYGNGFEIAPDAIIDDGLFNVCEVSDINKLEMLPLLIKLLKSTHIKDKKVNYFCADNLIVNSPIKLSCNIDGEIIKDNIFEFSIHKNSLLVDSQDNLKINKFLKEKQLIK